MSHKKVHIMLLGPVTNVEKNLIGGATILFGYLQDYLDNNNESYTLINTQKYPQSIKRILNPIYVLAMVMMHIWSADVFFLNSSRGGTKLLAPILYFLARIFRKKFVFRPFGGNLNEYTNQYNKIQKWIFTNTVLKADILFLETKSLMRYYADSDANIKQLPTSRINPTEELLSKEKTYQKRFIYLGFINQEKGIDIILEAAKNLGPEYKIDLYGPIMDQRYQDSLPISGLYQGVLNKEEVLGKLNEYDVLLLPTYYEGEGYPGAIIEAYSLGIPVITTHWRSIPEIVENRKTGLLIQPKSSSELLVAMKHFNSENFINYSKNARAYFLENFYSHSVNRRAIALVKDLFNNPVN